VSVSELQDSAQTRDQTFNNMLVLAAANIVTGLVEGVVTGYMLSFIGRVRPDLLEGAEGGGRKEKTEQAHAEAAHV
jgi:ABC-type Co2+ transport system permease subunit